MPEQLESHVDLGSLPKEERLARMRHSAAHVLAEAMVELFPDAELGIGPPIDTGFYYDFRLPRSLTPDDLTWLEDRMRKSVKGKHPYRMAAITKAEAEQQWKDQPFKLDLLSEIEEGNVTQCTHAAFTDLCRGGHVNHTGEIGAFKLTSIAGAYWRGSERNPQLQRVYGALFETPEELAEYEHQLEEARRRDHRRIGKEMKLFELFDEVGPGHVVWLPNGATIRRELMRWMEDLEIELGYLHVVTPNVSKRQLYVKSGHWDHFHESMYPVMERDDEEYVLRPMNCPSHIMVFAAELHSYRELPMRIAEFGNMHRWEKSGQVTGMSRVRIMTLNDAHIFCADVEQVEAEVEGVLHLMEKVYGTLGLKNYRYRLSLGDPENKEKYVDNPPMWERGEALLRRVLNKVGLEYFEAKDEAAFYGPKIDVQFMTAQGKEETLVTVQVDFHFPHQFGLEYVGEDGERHEPIIVHRGVISTMERMVALLIEEYEGNFPLWLAPQQAVVIPIADRHIEYANEVAAQLKAHRLRAEVDARGERMNAKIRDAQLRKVPYMLVVGDREAEAKSASLRVRGGGDVGAVPVADIAERLRKERDDKSLTLWA
ncbi:MAG: threonine--tRNA ligase [Chloroflexi bacterium]|nr:threonine--tRNA ligase [Dehalococcoidia bacterium]MCZ7578624.1 threonine--tRNA ligase [Dehalococcoidia bacterium]NJD65947.1 threonine--tRNA ligase [Chloroflexota bacterium]PWB44996.1 MAG: threonine--tRNA ligase [Dehalococcoidia bacterium]